MADLQVVRIPHKATKPRDIHLTRIPLIDSGSKSPNTNDGERLDLEKHFNQILNIKSVADLRNFSWAHHHLLGFTNKQGYDDFWKADFWMYVCVDPKSNLSSNEFLEEISDAADKAPRGAYLMPTVKVYGDAFVFRTKSKSDRQDGSFEQVEYMNMEEKSLPCDMVSGFPIYILQMLLRHSHKGEWKYKNWRVPGEQK